MRRRSGLKRKRFVFFKFFVLLIFVVVCLVIIDTTLRPQIRSIASVKACALIEQAVNDAVLSVLSNGDYENLVTVEKNAEGQVTAVRTDALKINTLKAGISRATGTVLSGTQREVSVPLGSVTGLDILSGRGPSVKVRVSFSGYSESRINSTFTGEGINQTVHRLILTVNSSVYISLPKSDETRNLSYEVCIAETLIVGYVPQLYANTD